MNGLLLARIVLSALIGVALLQVSAAVAPETAADAADARQVSGQVLTSTGTPSVRLEFDAAFKYVGHQSFTLYGVAQADQYFFVDADSEGRVKRFYWVQ